MNKVSFSYILSVQMSKFRQMGVKKLDLQKFSAWKSIGKVVIATEKIFRIFQLSFYSFLQTKLYKNKKFEHSEVTGTPPKSLTFSLYWHISSQLLFNMWWEVSLLIKPVQKNGNLDSGSKRASNWQLCSKLAWISCFFRKDNSCKKLGSLPSKAIWLHKMLS